MPALAESAMRFERHLAFDAIGAQLMAALKGYLIYLLLALVCGTSIAQEQYLLAGLLMALACWVVGNA